MTSGTISFSAVAVEEHPHSVRIFVKCPCKITASQAKDGVMQSVTFVDGHYVKIRLLSSCSDTLIVQPIPSRWSSCVSKRAETTWPGHVQGGHVDRHEQEQTEGNAAQEAVSEFCFPLRAGGSHLVHNPHLIARPSVPSSTIWAWG